MRMFRHAGNRNRFSIRTGTSFTMGQLGMANHSSCSPTGLPSTTNSWKHVSRWKKLKPRIASEGAALNPTPIIYWAESVWARQEVRIKIKHALLKFTFAAKTKPKKKIKHFSCASGNTNFERVEKIKAMQACIFLFWLLVSLQHIQHFSRIPFGKKVFRYHAKTFLKWMIPNPNNQKTRNCLIH